MGLGILTFVGALSVPLIAQGAQPADDGRLSTVIISPEGTKQCYLDARVGLYDGKVTEVALESDEAELELGERVLDLPDGLEEGPVIPGPVYRDAEGNLRAGYSECEEVAERAAAHHAVGNPKGWASLYQGSGGGLNYKAWTVSGGPVPTQDALLILDDVENIWEPMFDYALAAGGYSQFNFNPIPYNQSAPAKYARMDTIQQVQWSVQVPRLLASTLRPFKEMGEYCRQVSCMVH